MLTGEHLLTMRATVTSRTPTGVRDSYGNVQVAETVRTFVPFWHELISSGEFIPIGEQTHDAWFPPGDPLAQTDKVVDDATGEAFEVIGPPAQPVNPRTDELGLVKATLRRTTG